MVQRLLDDDALERSSVVANNAMNRVRRLAGANSYAKELGFDPLDAIRRRLAAGSASAAWLDLCCGSGRALAQAAECLEREGFADRVALVGVDLVDYFDPMAAERSFLQLCRASVTSWTPTRRFDLITCVHGLHYVGDKLSVLSRAAGWLTDEGLLVADLDPDSLRLPGGESAGRRITASLRKVGFTYDPRRRRISCFGRRDVSLAYAYLGADDRAGPNYTNQPVVHSYYEVLVRPSRRS